jgi:hypothetical protein
VRRFGHDLPTVAQHAVNVIIHRLQTRQQPLPVVFPNPIFSRSKDFTFIFITMVRSQLLQLPSGWSRTKRCQLLAIVGEQIAKSKLCNKRSNCLQTQCAETQNGSIPRPYEAVAEPLSDFARFENSRDGISYLKFE